MHQPDYRHHGSGEFALPWTYLHAIKDYTDMAYHLEQAPQARAVVNFVPILLDQLEDYSEQFRSGTPRDPLLRMLQTGAFRPARPAQRKLLLESCFRSNHSKMIEPYPTYKRLYDLYKLHESQGAESLQYLSAQYLADLLTWYHLSWIGKRTPRKRTGGGDDVQGLHVHLCRTPEPVYAHRRADPGDRAALPQARRRRPGRTLLDPLLPSARTRCWTSPAPTKARRAWLCRAPRTIPAARSAWHSMWRKRCPRTNTLLGVRPKGMWPAEGGVSQALAMTLAEHGLPLDRDRAGGAHQ